VGGVRWWNVKHPTAYADRLAAGVSPAAARELLTTADRQVERVLLEIRLREGLPLSLVSHETALEQRQLGLLEASAFEQGRAVLTLKGRLLADAVVRALT
jgi:oxygen-independent coproporphyrinogen-3 oxidase